MDIKGQITNTDFQLLLDIQKQTYCDKVCDIKKSLHLDIYIMLHIRSKNEKLHKL